MPISGPICCGTRCHIPISGGSTTAMAIESKASKNHAVQMISRIFRCHEQYGRRSSRATTWRMSPRSFETAAPVIGCNTGHGDPPSPLAERHRMAAVLLPRDAHCPVCP